MAKQNLSEINILFSKANDYYDKKNYHNALMYYEMLLELLPIHVDAINNKACVLEDLGDSKGAIKELDIAINFKPDYAKAYFNKANIEEKQGLFESAIQNYKKFIVLGKADSMYYDALINIGNIYYNLSKYDEALVYYDDAIDYDKWNPCAHYNRGLIFEVKDKNKKAIEEFNFVISMNSNYAKAYMERACCLSRLGQYSNAYDDYYRGIGIQYPNYYCSEMVKIFYNEEIVKSYDFYGKILSSGFLPSYIGDINKCIIMSPSISGSRIILDPKDIYISSTYKKYLKKHKNSYKLQYDADIGIIIENVKKRWEVDNNASLLGYHYCDVLNKNKTSPRSVGVALWYNNEIVAGDVGMELGKIYYSHSAFSNISHAGKVLCFMLAKELVYRGFEIWNLGGSNLRWNTYKMELGAKMISLKEYIELNNELNPGAEEIFTKKG